MKSYELTCVAEDGGIGTMILETETKMEAIEEMESYSGVKYVIGVKDIEKAKAQTEPPSLPDDQQAVLDWLINKSTITDIEPMELLWRLRVNSIKPGYRDLPVYKSYRYMTKAAQHKVLAAFAEWGLSQLSDD